MKTRKLQLLETAKRSGLFDTARRRTANGVRILNYHGIWNGPDAFPGDSMFFGAPGFERRLELIREWGYSVVTLAEAVAHIGGRRQLPANSVVITIDDGWQTAHQYMFPILRRRHMPATLYCDTAHLGISGPIPHVAAMYFMKLADRRPQQTGRDPHVERSLAELATDLTRPYADRLDATEKLARALGIDWAAYIASRTFHYMTEADLAAAVAASDGQLTVELHTHTHSLKDMSSAAVREEISLNRRALAKILARPELSFEHFCYPSGVFNDAAAKSIQALGIKSATTNVQGIAAVGTPLFMLPRICDNEMLTELEFEAEMSGFADWLRKSRSLLPLPRLRNSRTIATDLAAACALW